ncbi:cytochrome c oxidase subunit 3 [Marinirhabdus gelatinilytica]|uniref:Cytochrome c oxidase subunit 3 n=1 Tax=Marinirhabdus gelatinilytica TaxID=1703343 RepID=A0A370QIG8_9FLAO|nr:cytochrome c oxidase subunit 3 [Marinirhabdus gelatinilytica]RDK88154.1 cytochrome c oxidase subunit 3 [Marinirhabdus gelatinilytica]
MADYTEGTEEHKLRRAKKMMLWFGIISLSMSFAGWTSAYVVSKERPDWVEDLEIPSAFIISLVVILISSLTLHFAKRSIQKEAPKKGMYLLLVTIVLGLAFVFFQFKGFQEIIGIFGYNPTGPTSNITYTFIFLIAVVHLVHVVAGLVCLFVVLYNHSRKKYAHGKTLGVELATTFWHFVDILWVYLLLFFYIV